MSNLQVGTAVKIVSSGIGSGATGNVIATTPYGNYVVAFDTPVAYTANGETSAYARLDYSAQELDAIV